MYVYVCTLSVGGGGTFRGMYTDTLPLLLPISRMSELRPNNARVCWLSDMDL